MAADGSIEKHDTIPAMPVRGVKGIQSERDGALIPDAYGELPWPMIRADGPGEHVRLLSEATMRHRRRLCMGGECDDLGTCSRHQAATEESCDRSETVAEAAVQIRAILFEAVKRTGSYERDQRRQFIDDILEEARRP